MMQYVAIDIETTGLNPESHQILEIGCVVETDWRTPVEELPTFRALCNPGEIRGQAAALAMNAGLIRELSLTPNATGLDVARLRLSEFLYKHFLDFGKKAISIAGKNFGAFDLQFLRRCPGWAQIHHKHRYIDVGNLWWEPAVDECLPSLPECLERAGLNAVRPTHDAVEDCQSVIELVRAALARSSALRALDMSLPIMYPGTGTTPGTRGMTDAN